MKRSSPWLCAFFFVSAMLPSLCAAAPRVMSAPDSQDTQILRGMLLSPDYYRTATPDQVRKFVAGASLASFATDSTRNRDEYGQGLTPLMLAAWRSPYPEVIDILVKAGCEVNAQGSYRNTFYRSPRNEETEDLSSALHFAVLNPNPAIIRNLLRHKPDLDVRAKAPAHYSALELAVRKPERTEHLRFLLEAGARPTPNPGATRYSIWRFFLGYATGDFSVRNDPLVGLSYARSVFFPSKEAADKVRLLLARGIPPDADALGRALAAGHNEAARLLLAAGADPSANIDGKSMLFHALYRPNAKENTGYDPIDAPGPDPTLVRRLIQASGSLPNREELLPRACKSGLSAEIVRMLVEAGAPYSTRDNGLLFDALQSNNDCADLVEYLLSLGFSPILEKNGGRGHSPLYASREFPRQKPRCALILVKAGGDPKEIMGNLDRKFAVQAGILDVQGKLLVQQPTALASAEKERQIFQREKILAQARQDPWNALFSSVFYAVASPEDVASIIAASNRHSLAGVRKEKREITLSSSPDASPGIVLFLPVLIFKKEFWTGKRTVTYEYTPLDEAAGATPYPEVIHMLVKAGCDVRDMGSKALLSALFNPNSKVLEAVLQYKPDLQTTAFYLGTPLHMLAAEDTALFKKEHFRLLVAAGANVNVVFGQDKETPLMKAAFHGNTEAARMLLAAGAQTGISNRTGESALTIALGRESYDLARLLLKAGATANIGKALLHVANNKSTDAALVRDLMAVAGSESVEAGLSVMHAARSGHTIVLQSLLEAGARGPNAGETMNGALLAAVTTHPNDVTTAKDTPELIRLLLKHGAKPDSSLRDFSPETLRIWQHRFGWQGGEAALEATALHWAAYYGLAQTTAILLKSGATAEPLDGMGRTPLWWAAYYGSTFHDAYNAGEARHKAACLETAKVLLTAKTTPLREDADGFSPLLIGLHSKELTALFLQGGGKVKINSVSASGHTPLTLAAAHTRNAESIPLLLTAGADPQKPDRKGNLPLDIALKSGNGKAAAYIQAVLAK